jgi:hypothetical protein
VTNIDLGTFLYIRRTYLPLYFRRHIAKAFDFLANSVQPRTKDIPITEKYNARGFRPSGPSRCFQAHIRHRTFGEVYYGINRVSAGFRSALFLATY